MRTILYLSAIIVAIATATGCGHAPSDKSTAEHSELNGTSDDLAGFSPKRPASRYDDPRQAVNDFLVAVRAGDESTATSLLTTAAQKEAWSNGMAISSEGFPEAAFDISEVNYLKGKPEAEVWSIWADKTPYGEKKSFECVWLLRQETHGWCIYGMAAKFLEGVPPVVLPFEDQAEMAKRQQWAEQKIREQQQLELHQQQAISQGTLPPGNQAAATAPVRQQPLDQQPTTQQPAERQASRPTPTVR